MESIEKTLAAGDKTKRKEKKPGMLSGFFKRKDKKGRSSEDDAEDYEKTSEEISRSSPQPKISSESLRDHSGTKANIVQRSTSKLQKQAPSEIATTTQSQRSGPGVTSSASVIHSPIKEEFGPSIRRVISPSGGAAAVAPLQVQTSFDSSLPSNDEQTRTMYTTSPVKASPVKVSPVKTWRVTPPLETSSMVTNETPRETTTQNTSSENHPSESASSPQKLRQNMHSEESWSDSPVNISPIQTFNSQPPALVVDTSSPEERSVSPPSSRVSSSPELIEGPEVKADEMTPVSTVSSTATATWSDTSLRMYLEDENDIRDLLIIVHDKSNVQPAGPDHPITGSLFKEESRRLKEMSGRLDEMLATWVSRKSDHRANRAF